MYKSSMASSSSLQEDTQREPCFTMPPCSVGRRARWLVAAEFAGLLGKEETPQADDAGVCRPEQK
jgi:hypothetical protein